MFLFMGFVIAGFILLIADAMTAIDIRINGTPKTL